MANASKCPLQIASASPGLVLLCFVCLCYGACLVTHGLGFASGQSLPYPIPLHLTMVPDMVMVLAI